MTIQTFIEKAWMGGFYGEHPLPNDPEYWPGHIHQLVLMPDAWKAVGKVEGWKKGRGTPQVVFGFNLHVLDVWEYNMHRMIDTLAEGKTIEQFLETL